MGGVLEGLFLIFERSGSGGRAGGREAEIELVVVEGRGRR